MPTPRPRFYLALELADRDGATRRVAFTQDRVSVGASDRCDVVVRRLARSDVHHAAHFNCSPFHGGFWSDGERLLLREISTSNGIHVINEQTVALGRYHKDGGYPVTVGDRYYVGDTKITVVDVDMDPP